MVFSPNIDDRERDCFAYIQDLTVKNVRPLMDDGDSLPVHIVIGGTSKIFFNEVLSVASGSVTEIVSYTVPAGKLFSLSTVNVSGSNIASYKVKLNGSVIIVKRSWWTRFNLTFGFTLFELQAGDILTVDVTHNRPTSADFECSIIGSEL